MKNILCWIFGHIWVDKGDHFECARCGVKQ